MKKILKVAVLSSGLMIGGLTSYYSPLGIQQVEAASTIKISSTIYKTTANLNLRSGASTKYKSIILIPKGKTVIATEKNGSWYKVSYSYKSNGKTLKKSGWVSGKYLKEYYKYTNTSGAYLFTSKTTKLYPTPDTKKKELYSLAANNGLYSTQKVINSKNETWYRVSFREKNLYVKNTYVKKESKLTIPRTTFKANVDTYIYKSYGISSSKLAKIEKDTLISSTSHIGPWYKASFSGETGYIYSEDFTKEKTEPVLIESPISASTYIILNDQELNKSADETSSVLVTVPKGKIVTPTHKVSNGWYKLTYDGKTGYVTGSSIKEVRTGAPLSGRDGYQFIDLRTKSSVTAADINNYIDQYVQLTGKKSVLTGKGQAFIDAGNKYGVNALYLAAHAIHESAYGTSLISLGKNNLFGFGAYDAAPFVAAFRFSSVNQNIEYIAREMKATYLNADNWKYKGAFLGYSTKTTTNSRLDEFSQGMNYFYASDPYWGKGIAAHMERILPYNKSYYKATKPNTTVYTSPAKPAGSDKFPTDIKAVAKKELKLSSSKGSTTVVTKIKKDEEFTILEKTNDFWVKIEYGDKTYWTSDIKFDRYKEFLTVKNLGRVTTSLLNVRPTASTSKDPISVLKLNQYVQLVLDKEGKLTTNSSKTWYKVKLSNGETGWVMTQYIARELK